MSKSVIIMWKKGTIIRIGSVLHMLNKANRSKIVRQLYLITLDTVIVFLCAYLALAIRFDFNIPYNYLITTSNFILFDLIINIFIFYLFRLYSSLWKYASITELFNIVFAITIVVIIEFLYKSILNINIPISYHILNYSLMLLIIGASRMIYRTTRYLKHNLIKTHIYQNNTLVIGAGEAGTMLIKDIRYNMKNNNHVICIIDDDNNKRKKYLLGIPIVGGTDDIIDVVNKYDIKEIIIAIPSASPEKIKNIIDICRQTECKIKLLPRIQDVDYDAKYSKLRDVQYEDLLGREPVKIEDEVVRNSIKNKVVLVTGGGGSIGSEICRQIANMKPKKLIIVDIYENNAYDIQMELERNYPKLDLETIIASVRDLDRMDDIFREMRPNIVYHAAAHKHVPLMEKSPNEAIKNNCGGTLNVAKVADKYEVDKFVLISSDKAVRPTNIMGASKRICEMIIQTYNKRSKTNYVAVRFGNVLGSNGSVIPLFLKQIENGGPVTVTHKKITRYFMTIKEAVLLVLQAGEYAEGGEIFVLDMGSPVNIYDLATDLIKLKGLTPGKDIEIKITGLRPGEKLYEEMLMDEEGLEETPNKLIYIGKPIKMNEKIFLNRLDKLIKAANENNEDIKEMTANVVDTYNVYKEDKELVR